MSHFAFGVLALRAKQAVAALIFSLWASYCTCNVHSIIHDKQRMSVYIFSSSLSDLNLISSSSGESSPKNKVL